MGKAYIGTSGFYYSSWIGDFYPSDIKKEDLLPYYQKKFSTVEINSSFYHIPREKTIENWKSKVSRDFIFVFKASKIITHLKKFNVDRDILQKVLSPLRIFSSKEPEHIILFQTPGNIKANKEKLTHLLTLLPKTFLYAFEFRHETWFSQEIYDILKKYNCAVVLSDSPIKANGERLWPLHDVDTANFTYIRFHGSEKLYYSSYTNAELSSYANSIRQKTAKGMNVYAYFNNDAGGFATKNALSLEQLVLRQ
jgi:uncharacterized protein YecE (DUF72 family)